MPSARFSIATLLAFPIFGLVSTNDALAQGASQAGDVSVGWRPTARRAYVFLGTSDEQFDLPDLIADSGVKQGVRNSHTELGRFEGEANLNFLQDLSVGTRVSGGRFRLRVAATQPVQTGQDYTWDLHTHFTKSFTPNVSVTAVAGARVRKWWFEGGKIPSHGNVGLILGLEPKVGPVTLLVEATLAAVWLGNLNAWGAQKDSSILRIRPAYTFEPAGSALSYSLGAEYYHTHTEYFGSKLVAGQSAIMLDDFELSAIVGTRYRF